MNQLPPVLLSIIILLGVLLLVAYIILPFNVWALRDHIKEIRKLLDLNVRETRKEITEIKRLVEKIAGGKVSER